ncbi:MAG: hypothetical protein RIM83_05685 [Allomuricauda sp.]
MQREKVENETIARFGHNGLNDKSDAFRHAFFNVINAKKVGQYTARLFSDAHESEVPQHLAKEKQMDLFNNNVGHHSISGNSMKSENELANIIYQKLLNGDLRYLSPININDPNFPYTHGISNLTKLIPTDQ